MANGHEMDIRIEDAIHKIATDPENATDRDFSLAVAGYLAHMIKESRWSFKRMAVPFGAGGGGLVAVIEGVKALVGGG